MKFRREEDYLGKKKIPFHALYGIQSARARDNFQINGSKLPDIFIRSYAFVKRSAAMANRDLRSLDPRKASAIIRACEEIMSGKHQDQFIIDAYQAGAGTSQNMNINEVIANRAIEILGGKRGDYSLVHPNDHVNMSQSSNDTFPTAMRISILLAEPSFMKEMQLLISSLRKKAREFRNILKSGRTHLQDAVPVTLGMEFEAWAAALASTVSTFKYASRNLHRIPLGGTAVGTGLNAHPAYKQKAIAHLKKSTGFRFVAGKNCMELIQSTADFSIYSSAQRNCALALIKISNDIRILSSGPNTGIAELILPSVQPGSSIMPGKINPVICEALAMICFQVIGNDATVACATQAGQLELNVMTPVIIKNILTSTELLKNGSAMFRSRCIDGIKANKKKCRIYYESSQGIATLLNPVLGFQRASAVVQEASRTGESIVDLLRKKKYMTAEQIQDLFSSDHLTKQTRKAKPSTQWRKKEE